MGDILSRMARKPRVEFAGAFSHVMARGNHRQEIFHDDEDRTAYLDRLERYRQRDGCTVYAYVLMTNHVHLLLETGETPLSRTMQTLQFTYTQYYNRRYRKTGHLFQGRYTAILCDRDAYLLELVRYIHLNPARLQRPLDPWRYRWSSHRAYLGQPSAVAVNTSVVLSQFGRQVGRAREAYLRFMKEGHDLGHEARYYETVDQRFLGDERFIEHVEQRTKATREVTVKGPRQPFSKLLAAVAQVHAVPPEAIVHPGRQRDTVGPRALLVYVAREWGRLTTRELGRRLHRDPSMISRLYATYAAQRDVVTEARLRSILAKQVNTHA